MIGQYLSNTNENATVSILQKNLELNKAKDVVYKNVGGANNTTDAFRKIIIP